ncbi:MAG: hypothetical protein KDK39_00145 [Leptospiraceae bacterium]|nr:hypothetical protein [Leptospiraceae bacterium]
MLYSHHHTSRKKKRDFGWLKIPGLLLLIATGGGLAWLYAPDLYYRLSGDSLYRISNQNEALGQAVLEKQQQPADLLHKIHENRKIVQILAKADPVDAQIAYQAGLLDFLELMVYMPLNSENLVQLTARGWLPTVRQIAGQKKAPAVTSLSLKCARQMRRSLAIDAAHAAHQAARLIITLCDLNYSGRTDPQLAKRLASIQVQELPDWLYPVYEWTALSLHTLRGEVKDQDRILAARPQAIGGEASPETSNQANQRHYLQLTTGQVQLLQCLALFQSGSYLQSLYQARKLQSDQNQDLAIRVEGARMVAEIFLKQRGQNSALFFMQAAWELSGREDDFIAKRIQELESQ